MKTSGIRTDLNQWKFALDQTGFGIGAGWTGIDYDDSAWKSVDCYSSWETYEYALRDYEGKAWFRTSFVPASAVSNRYILHFDGVGGCAKVYVNGKYAGGTENRYLPFELDVTLLIRRSRKYVEDAMTNVIAVLVDNSFHGEAHLPGGQGMEWVPYGGLTHHVWLEERDSFTVSHVRADAGADGTLRVVADVNNASAAELDGELILEVAGLPECTCRSSVHCGVVSRLSGNTTQVVLETRAENAKLWSPEEPNLYDLKLSLYKDGKLRFSAEERIGFRTVEAKAGELLLNGKKLTIKGCNRYDEYAPYGICPPEEKIRQDLMEMKKMGINLVCTHYPQDPVHYRIADEIGLMYMLEVPLNRWQPRADSYYEDHMSVVSEAVDCLDRAFYWHGNHPSWIICSLGNHCANSTPACDQLLRTLAQRIRRLDCGRLITYAARELPGDGRELDFCDVLSVRFCSNMDMNKMKELYPNSPLLVTDVGYPCVRGIRSGGTETAFTEESGAAFMQQNLAGLRNTSVCGIVLWSWADYRCRRNFTVDGRHVPLNVTYGPYGIVTMDRKPKELLKKAVQKALKDWDD